MVEIIIVFEIKTFSPLYKTLNALVIIQDYCWVFKIGLNELLVFIVVFIAL